MAEVTIGQAMDLALEYHQGGRLREAEEIYRAILGQQPGHADAMHLLGVAAKQNGRGEEAVELIRRAIGLKPDFPEALNNLGIMLMEMERLDEAIAAFEQAVARASGSGEIYNNLGIALCRNRQAGRAIAAHQRAIAINPSHADAHCNMGNALLECGRVDEAVLAYRRTVELRADFGEAWSNLASALLRQGQVEESIVASRRAIELRPRLADGHFNLANGLKEKGNLDNAAAAYRQAIALNPGLAKAHNNLGNVHKDQGKMEAAMACHRRAVELEPGFAPVQGNLVYDAYFCPDYGPARIFEEARRWARKQAGTITPSGEHGNDRSIGRRLRVGYVSPDFLEHPVGRLLLPLLENHDGTRVEVYCYADVRKVDGVTHKLRNAAREWRETTRLGDGELADLIRKDGIDILVDLSLHMAGNRLLVFARKPAPVQVTYLGYCGTSGLEAMDYRLSDAFLDPPGLDEKWYSEKTVRLGHCYWCYPEREDSPEVNDLPAMNNGGITFGCFNNFCKISPATIECWIELMRGLPGSRLVVHSLEGSHRQGFCETFAAGGVDPARLRFAGVVWVREYLEQYREVDIALDPFPYGGGTTTCDALWMGVPVITLAGDRAVGRGGVTLLSHVGMTEWIAKSPEEYVEIGRRWANDLARLGALRQRLREMMRRSVVMDGKLFAADVEAVYRMMWEKWVATGR